MHLGNLWIAFLNWLWTRQHKGKVILRIEDIDKQRCSDIFTRGILHDLEWMGLDYDEGPENQYSYGSTVQSHRLQVYESILRFLASSGDIYAIALAPEYIRYLQLLMRGKKDLFTMGIAVV